ncbi:MAG: SLBB domain-containing protein [Chitinophagaceae bacterium]|nr:SLBB domain-containing protein [Chitinophagaceae bacterium]
MRKLINVVLLYFIFFHSFSLKAQQDLFKSKDLSSIRIETLSETEISQVKTQLESSNLTIEQVEPMLKAKGMSSGEYAKLKERLISTTSIENIANQNSQATRRTQEPIKNNKVRDSVNSRIFGSELFDNPNLNFEPNLKLATPLNYVLGPGDELQVTLYGVQEFNAAIPVTEEGRINIIHVGQVPVAGMTIEAATQKIKNSFAKTYTSLRSGQSKLSISLNKIRTIKVTIIGGKQPGNYSISSLSTVFNALYLAGGPATYGTYRNIELVRNNKLVTKIDIYKFLVNGDQSENVGLKDNDVIRIPVYNSRITLDGEVKRPGIFEVKPGETFADILAYASGFSDVAFTASVNVVQKTDREYKVKDLKNEEFKIYQPLPGDVITISKILSRFQNRIQIQGAVFRPNSYSFYEGMRMKDLLAKAEGLREDAYTKRAIITRLKTDLTTEILNVDIEKVLAGDVESNVLLKKEDQVKVYSILEFREKYMLTINGEIRRPGEYEFHENLTLNDLLIQAGGLLNSASNKVEIARMVKAEDISTSDSTKAQLFNVAIDASNNEQTKTFLLQPFDVINIRKMAVYEKPQLITIGGAVPYAGEYVLSNKNEKVYDLIKRAGGLTAEADVMGVKIRRPIQASQIEAISEVNLNLDKNDSTETKLTKKLKEEVKYAVIPIEWNKISEDPNNYSNITLLAGDAIEVATRNENVKVTGNVLLTSEIPFVKGKGLNYYVNAVGGADSKAWKKKAYIIYPNGKAAVTSNFLFFRFFPKVTAGSQIVIPEKPLTNKVTAGEITSFASVLVGMAGVVIAIIRR